MTRHIAPVLFFGTDEARNEGVKDFRPTNVSAVKAEMEAAAKEAVVAPVDDPEEVPKEMVHPSTIQNPETTPTTVTVNQIPTSPTGNPDLDLFS